MKSKSLEVHEVQCILNMYLLAYLYSQVRQNLGYCPQYDALIDQMTGRETLFMFARLRGVKEEKIPAVVEGLMAALLFEEHADKMVKAYR